MPAFWKNGLWRAITAVVSTWGVPARRSVWLTSFCASTVVRYFGCVMTRLMLLSLRFSSAMGIRGSTLFRPAATSGGYV